MIPNDSLIIRYSMLSDDTTQDSKDIARIAEFVCSLLSVKIYLHPYVKSHIVIYSTESYIPRLNEILNILKFDEFSFILLDNEQDIAFSETIKNCEFVDRICIRRMLADFRELPSTNFRLLLGTDCFFFNVPHDLINFINKRKRCDSGEVLYMIDNITFNGVPYNLKYYSSPILEGLLGDFYCLSPNVSLTSQEITSCLELIDSWPVYGRWTPDLPRFMQQRTHACEQQAAAILLGHFSGQKLPSRLYNHLIPKLKCTLLHNHYPWQNISLKEMPIELSNAVIQAWKILGYQSIIDKTTRPEMSNASVLKRRIKQYLWYMTDILFGF